SVGAGVLLGLAPAFRASGRAAGSALQETDRAGAGPGRTRVRNGLVIAQTALALVLLVGAGLLVRSFRNLLSVSPGFEPDRLLSVSVFLGPPAYRELAPQRAFVRDTLAAVERIPGVVSAATVSHLPMADGAISLKLAIEGRPADRADAPVATYRAVSPGLFRTMGIPLREGRPPSEGDTERAPLVVVVNEALAKQVWPGESPIGRRLRFIPEGESGGKDARWHTVVGVVGDVKSEGLDRDEGPATYVSYSQRVLPFVRA